LFSFYILFGVLFHLFFVLLVSGHNRLDVSLFEKIQDYEEKTLSSRWEARQVTLDQIDSMCSFSSIHIGLHDLILLPKHHTYDFGTYLVSYA
jgi:hypothetical protein